MKNILNARRLRLLKATLCVLGFLALLACFHFALGLSPQAFTIRCLNNGASATGGMAVLAVLGFATSVAILIWGAILMVVGVNNALARPGGWSTE